MKGKGQPKGWITKNGVHIPIFENYTVVKNEPKAKLRKSVRFSEEKYKHINPGYKENTSVYDKDGFNNNCAMCAIAFEANMRGEDTEANQFKFGYPEYVKKSRNVNEAFGVKSKDIVMISDKKADMRVHRLKQHIEDWNDGDRGILQTWGKNSRHVMNVLYQNGKMIIVDSQAGKHEDITNTKNSKLLKGTFRIDVFKTTGTQIDEEYAKWAYKKRGK